MPNSDSESLMHLMNHLHTQYRELDELVDSMSGPADISAQSIGERMQKIAETESQLRPLRERYRQEHDELSPELRAANSVLIELLKAIMPKLAQLEKTTLDSFERLYPQIQESVRGVQMRNAYQAANRAS